MQHVDIRVPHISPFQIVHHLVARRVFILLYSGVALAHTVRIGRRLGVAKVCVCLWIEERVEMYEVSTWKLLILLAWRFPTSPMTLMDSIVPTIQIP